MPGAEHNPRKTTESYIGGDVAIYFVARGSLEGRGDFLSKPIAEDANVHRWNWKGFDSCQSPRIGLALKANSPL